MSAAYCPPNLIATSSYGGELIVWNMVSGHLFCRLRSSVSFESDGAPGWSNHVDTLSLYIFIMQESLANAKVSARQPCTSKTDFDMK